MRILLLTPPMTQLNTPYPATAYLAGFLRQHRAELGVEVAQADPALELFLRLFSRAGLELVAKVIAGRVAKDEELASASDQGAGAPRDEVPRDEGEEEVVLEEMPPSVAQFLAELERYLDTIDPVIAFLQGARPELALRISGRRFLPEGPRFAPLGDPGAEEAGPLGWAFGAIGDTDRAKHLASLYLDDLADVIRDAIDPRFGLSRYGEKLAAAAPSFAPLRDALEGPPTLVDELLDDIARELVATQAPDLVGLTVPFPGNLYGALRLARAMRAASPTTRFVLGGGYVNTELRELSEPALFDYVDFVTLDDGERPLWALISHLRAGAQGPLLRTFLRRDGRVEWHSDASLADVPMRDAGTPTYAGLPLHRYVSTFEMLNPMMRLWSDGRWNKLTVAHGCYWKKCTFCDVSLDYIARYDPTPADTLVDRMEAMIAETGQRGFHFVDEAAPPAGLRAMAERLLSRKLTVTWWGNIRFEKAFSPGLVELLASSGCVAVSGGLEVASDRLLGLIDKGVTVAQVARVTRTFADAGVFVHAYLMYGFPTQTVQETVDSLELVRQLFEAGCVHSAYWHRFAATVHSPIGKRPELFGIRLRPPPPNAFARNDAAFTDATGVDHDWLGEGLRRALYNFMHGMGLDEDVRSWFGHGTRARGRRSGKANVPPPEVAADTIARALEER